MGYLGPLSTTDRAQLLPADQTAATDTTERLVSTVACPGLMSTDGQAQLSPPKQTAAVKIGSAVWHACSYVPLAIDSYCPNSRMPSRRPKILLTLLNDLVSSVAYLGLMSTTGRPSLSAYGDTNVLPVSASFSTCDHWISCGLVSSRLDAGQRSTAWSNPWAASALYDSRNVRCR